MIFGKYIFLWNFTKKAEFKTRIHMELMIHKKLSGYLRHIHNPHECQESQLYGGILNAW